MKWWVLAAGLLAAAVAPQAFAADLDDGGEPLPPPGWKYKDGAYGYPHKATPPPGYYDDEEGPPPRYGKRYYDEDDDGPSSRKYSDKTGCVRSEDVRDRLTSLGWRDFHSGKAIGPGLVKLRARRPSGRLFELRLDRCSGRILEARALELSPLRPYYGYGYGEKRPDRPYWGGGYGPYGYMGPYAGRYDKYGKRPPRADWDDD
jgi:hypothetical protein